MFGYVVGMPFTPEQQSQIVEVISSKVLHACPSCGKGPRSLVPELVLFSFAAMGSPPTWSPQMGTSGGMFAAATAVLPCVCLTCMNCGFAQFFNVHIIGVAAKLGIPAPGVPLG